MVYVLENRPEAYGCPKIRGSGSPPMWDYIFKPVRIFVVIAAFFALWVNRGESKRERLSGGRKSKSSWKTLTS